MVILTKFTLILIMLVFVVGCEDYGQTPISIIEAKRPVVLISKSESGVVFRDADGNVYAFDENFYFAQNIIAGQFIVGDSLTTQQIEE